MVIHTFTVYGVVCMWRLTVCRLCEDTGRQGAVQGPLPPPSFPCWSHPSPRGQGGGGGAWRCYEALKAQSPQGQVSEASQCSDVLSNRSGQHALGQAGMQTQVRVYIANHTPHALLIPSPPLPSPPLPLLTGTYLLFVEDATEPAFLGRHADGCFVRVKVLPKQPS